jgi:hypothetical protein
MLVQYLVGLCCLRRNADAVNVTVGDLVMDTAANKPRDVDVTVTVAEPDGSVRAFKCFEVKREAAPLDVAAVEQLCVKLQDMPSVTNRAIVSASGFTSAAIAKATAHRVELFAMKPWTRPVSEQFPEFPLTGPPSDCIEFRASLLVWLRPWRTYVCVPDGPASFSFEDATQVYSADGGAHARFNNMSAFMEELLMRSTNMLFRLEPALSALRDSSTLPTTSDSEPSERPPWPHSHTLQVREDGVYMRFEHGLAAVDSVTISGQLQWQTTQRTPEYYVLERVPDGAVFAGAAIATGLRDGHLMAIVFAPDSRTTGVHQIELDERHKNMIRKLRLHE